MRIWPWQLLPFLPEAQFKGQLRELVAIVRDIQDKGKTNHLLINRVMDYPRYHLLRYYSLYSYEYKRRYGREIGYKITRQFIDFVHDYEYKYVEAPFPGWHDDRYLRICMANLYEKYLGVGKSKVTNYEWKRLCNGYKLITGNEYVL